MRLLIALVISSTTVLTSPGLAQDGYQGPVSVEAYWENDAVFYKPNHPTDRWYTNGAGISVLWEPRFAEDLSNWLPFAEQFGEADRVPIGFTVGQLMFAPDDIRRSTLIPNDRPYAGYLYGAAIVQRIRGNTMDHFQLEIGQTGDASLGEDAQKFVHEILDGDEPMGWDNQIDDEIQFQAYVRKRWRLDLTAGQDQTAEASDFGVQIIPEIGGALGTVYRHVEIGMTARIGWRLPDDFGPSRLQSIAPPAERQDGWSIYGFLRTTARISEENLFVEGSYSRGGHGLDNNVLVGEFQGGVKVACTSGDWSVNLGYSQTYTTPEFDDQPAWHGFGAWTLAVQHWF